MIDKDQISSWLKDKGLDPKEGTFDKGDWLLTFAFIDIPIIIVKPKGEPRVVIQRAIRVSEKTLASIKDASLEKRIDFLNSLKRDLVLSHIRYTLDFEDDRKKSILKGLVLENHIFEDGMSQDCLFQRIYNLHDSTILFFLSIQKYRFES